MLVDVHCHLNQDYYKTNLNEIIKRTVKENILVINCGTTKEGNRKVLELSKKHSNIKAALGIYPTHCEEMSDSEFEEELKFIEKNKDNIIAISEIGLDGKEGKDLEKQKRYFQKFIDLSKKIDKPMIVHSRNMELEVIEMLEKNNIKNVIMHCFSGNKKLIERIINNDWYFSIPCTIIKLEHFQNIVKLTENILTETDSPFLSPFKDKVNEPLFVKESIKKISEIKHISEKDVEGLIYSNFKALFIN